MVSPTEADAGNVIVQAFEVVLIQYPLPATAVKVVPVVTDCQAVPPTPEGKDVTLAKEVLLILSAGNVPVVTLAASRLGISAAFKSIAYLF